MTAIRTSLPGEVRGNEAGGAPRRRPHPFFGPICAQLPARVSLFTGLAPARRRPHMLNKEQVRERDMRQFEFSTEHDGQGHVKPIVGGKGAPVPRRRLLPGV